MSAPEIFRLEKNDGTARAGRLFLKGLEIETPVFMPVGTQGTVKGVLAEQVFDVGYRLILGNAYHLHLRPGDERIARFGGLAKFMGYKGAILTNSGGFQVFSLGPLVKLSDEGVEFRSHIDGAKIFLTPEKVVEIQLRLGSDIQMQLDVCPAADSSPSVVNDAVEKSQAWARRAFSVPRPADRHLFGIVQGGIFQELRKKSALGLTEIGFPGYGIGGLSVGEAREAMHAALSATTSCLPPEKPRYLMGVGHPVDLVESVARGVDLFDCVMATRNARNAGLFTRRGQIKITNAKYADDETPIEPNCPCPLCRTASRAYLRHLFRADEMLGPTLATLHNLTFFFRLMREMREAICANAFDPWRRDFLSGFETRSEDAEEGAT